MNLLRSLRRLCFYTCLSFCSRAGGATWAGTQPDRYTPRQVHTQAGTPPGQVHPPGRYTPRQVHSPRTGTPPWQVHPQAITGRYTPQAGTPPGRYTRPGRYPLGRYPPGQVHLQAGSRYIPLAGTGRYTPSATVHAGIRSTSGWYASHWNAFLFIKVIVKF